MLRCGIDMIEIERIEQGIARLGERFLNRFFTAGERADCEDRAHRLAARLAGKEAVAKALGTGIGDVRWKDIEIRVDNPRHRPTLHLHGAAVQVAADLGLTQWDISLTHTRAYASAVVVASSGDEAGPATGRPAGHT
ncbi:MAG: holo-ACP synthase [Anaerolineae bacterium]|jgi:holo-[acyl-carrier protein] synthase|nr:holo-ACP synthase [Anaerolineae bacterium]